VVRGNIAGLGPVALSIVNGPVVNADLVLPARPVTGPVAGWGRALALAFGVPAAIAVALLCQWPARSMFPAQTILNTLVTTSYVATAIMIATTRERRAVAYPLIGAGLLWAVSWSVAWDTGVLPVVSVAAQTAFWLLIAWACFRYPDGWVSDRAARVFLAVQLGFLPLMDTGLIVLSHPRWRGLPGHHIWWPGVLANRRAFDATQCVAAFSSFALSITFVVMIARRLARLPRVERRILAPIGVALGLAGICAGVNVVFSIGPAGRPVSRLFLLMTVALLALPVSFGVAAVRARIIQANATNILVRLASPPTVEGVQAAVAEALRDPTARIVFRLPGENSFVDASGRATEPPPPGGARLIADVRSSDGEQIALLDVDGALRRQGHVVEAVVATAGLALENARLQAILRSRLAAVRASRTRIVAAALAERRRLEQDLHDGAQQRLLAVVARIGLARLQADGVTAREIDAVRDELLAALKELRAVARGIYPPVLSDTGLADALDAAMETFPIPVALSVASERFDSATETAAYLTILDVLTHATRTAGATRATVSSSREADDLWLSVEHDGHTAGPLAAQPGLAGADDRLRALDGALYVLPGEGVVKARIPCG
jgi:signal transduction histidine kinase